MRLLDEPWQGFLFPRAELGLVHPVTEVVVGLVELHVTVSQKPER